MKTRLEEAEMRPNTTVCPGSAKILKKMAKKEGKTPGGGPGGGMGGGGGGGGGETPRHERLLRQGKQYETRRKEAVKKEEVRAGPIILYTPLYTLYTPSLLVPYIHLYTPVIHVLVYTPYTHHIYT